MYGFLEDFLFLNFDYLPKMKIAPQQIVIVSTSFHL